MSQATAAVPTPAPRSTIVTVGLCLFIVLICSAFFPFQSAWNFVAPKQLILVIGSLACLSHLSMAAATAPVPWQRNQTRLQWWTLGIGALWLTGLMVRGAMQPPHQRYEMIWGASVRGTGLVSYLALGVLASWVCMTPVIQASHWFRAAMRTAAAVVAAYGTAQYLGYDFIDTWTGDARYLTTIGNLNQSAAFYATATSVFVWSAVATPVASRRFWRNADGALAIWSGLLCAATYRAGSRQGLFLLAILAAVVGGKALWINRRQANRLWLWVVAIACVGAIAFAARSVVIDHGASDRVLMWQTALQIIWDRPWFGIGISQLQHQWDGYRIASDVILAGYARAVDDIHSAWLQQAIIGGMPIALLSAACTSMLTLLAWRAVDLHNPARQSGAALLWLGCFGYGMFNPFSLVLDVLGAVAAGVLLMPDGSVAACDAAAPKRRWRRTIVGCTAVVSIASVIVVPRMRSELAIDRAWVLRAEQDGPLFRLEVERDRMVMQTASLLEQRPHDTYLRMLVGRIALESKNVPLAISIFAEGVRAQPDACLLRAQLAVLRLINMQPDSAIVQLDTLVTQMPLNVPAALQRQIAAQAIHDPVALNRASIFVDGLGRRLQISRDSMKVLHDRLVSQLDGVVRATRRS